MLERRKMGISGRDGERSLLAESLSCQLKRSDESLAACESNIKKQMVSKVSHGTVLENTSLDFELISPEGRLVSV